MSAEELSEKIKSRTISEECFKLIDEIEALNIKLAQFSSEEILSRSALLTEYRSKSSSTIQKGSSYEWMQANQYVSQKLIENAFPTWEDISHINKLFNPATEGQVRMTPVYIGNYEACKPNELPLHIKTYREEILNPQNSTPHALILACRARYWLVTLHPFVDGNGRTSNLICDWILGLNGYLPMTFGLKVDSHIGGWGERAQFSDLNYASVKTLLAVKHSYQLILNK